MGHGGAVKGEVCQRKEQDEEIRKQSQGQRPVAGALRASGIPLQATRKLSPSLQQRLSSCFSRAVSVTQVHPLGCRNLADASVSRSIYSFCG